MLFRSEHAKGHRQNAARILGISERNLYRKLKEIEPRDVADDPETVAPEN